MIWASEDKRNRALKSFKSFLLEGKSQIFNWRTGAYMCRHCDGAGNVISPFAYNDPVEGYKMADRVVCQHCFGTGISDEKSWKAFYKEEKSRNDERLKAKLELDNVRKNALKKLTDAEKKALNLQFYK